MARFASRLLFALVWLGELLLVLVLAAVLAAWVWSGTQGSLATLLREAPGYLPAGQTLEAQSVQGSIRQGGRIGLLRWSAGGLTVTARELRIDWSPLQLLRRRLQVEQLAVADLQVDDRRPAATGAAGPPTELLLPLDVDLALRLDRLRLAGATAFEASALAGRYRYQDHSHQIRIDSAQLAQGHYQGSARLQARVPMALELQVEGQLQAPIGDHQRMVLDASGSASGALAGVVPRLDLQVLVQPASSHSGPTAGSRATRAHLSAQISPWAAQPVVRAQASFSQLDLAALWPNAPRTLLTGNAWVRPEGPHWLGELNLINRADGPWDKGRLPVAGIRGLIEYGAGHLRIESLSADAAGGQIRLQGSLADAAQTRLTTGWQGQLQLRGVDPALMHSKLESIRLDGELAAAAAQDGIDFDLALRPAPQQQRLRPALRGLQLQAAAAKGRWAGGWLRLQRLDIRSSDATLEGRMDLQPATRAASGQLQLAAPGLLAQGSVALAERDGTGQLSVQLQDAQAARRWLARLPINLPPLDTLAVDGSATAELRWRGWQPLRLPAPADCATFDAHLTIPQLVVGSTGQGDDQQLRLRQIEARLEGPISALAFSASGNLARGSLQTRLQAAARGGRDPRGDWRASVTQLQARVREATLPGPWTLTLQQPLALAWSLPPPGASSGPALQVGAAQAALAGPAPGTALLAWEPVRWQRGGSPELASKGMLRGLPLGWLTLFAGTELAAAGLSGDLLFDGQWDLTLAQRLSLRASLGRRSGDLRLQTEPVGSTGPAANGVVTAGVRVLQLDLRGQDDALSARFAWDSERAGNARIDLSTRLTRGQDGWGWPADSTIAGTVRAQMPQLGVWSLLAPPGWRVRGTADASLELAGTRSAPQWTGTLAARELALRSVADGIEFGNGQLRATLQGQRLQIDHFSLQGAGGRSGGELTATGYAQWQGPSAADAAALAAVDLQIDAVARALRVSARADRRLALSGTLQAALRRATLQVRGALTVDQALFILPDESAPSLGSDVVVLGRGGSPRRGDQGSGSNAAADRQTAAPAQARGVAAGLRGDLLVALDLGSDFKVRGRGIDTRLAGALELRSSLRPGEAPTVHGELRTVGGQYKAYGQQLEIERGLMRFNGPYDNPALDILAIRPKLTQRVGVQITGSALLPRVRLYAEPDLPEVEKLAWLVLGRSAANGGAEAAVLQQAAMALLGGQDASGGIAGRLGLDELSVAGSTDNAGATTATLTLGKRIAQNFYVTYEHSLAGTLGAFSIFYDLSDRLTLRARTGERSAIDLIFTVRYE